ncbi:hypothetical protein NQZ68_035293 [Dissostichus eleginoides]|nr:hypothetical protein NQZ68_035293 [Dissostichus eleginoides]
MSLTAFHNLPFKFCRRVLECSIRAIDPSDVTDTCSASVCSARGTVTADLFFFTALSGHDPSPRTSRNAQAVT